jgi:hypothetical protein
MKLRDAPFRGQKQRFVDRHVFRRDSGYLVLDQRKFSNFIRLFQVWQSKPRDAAETGGRRQS